ncbi:MAG: S8 family serine peptidase [Planctomycetes bacterium]|nr:S8 family serine peptidase [Planctomycetota bacterium]
MREAILARRPAAEVDAIVAGLERAVVADQAAFVAAAERLGARITQQWWLIDAAALEIDPARLDALRRLPNVAFVQPDESRAPLIATATNASNHNADVLQAQGHLGLGVTAGVMDTGQDENVGGTGRPHRTYFVGGDPNNLTGGGIGGSRLLVNRALGSMVADDVHGHGTGVASIAAGANWGIASADDGHAPRAGIAGYSIANSTNGNSSLAVMATAWQTMAADRAQYGIVAANLSYTGSPDPLDASQQALDSAALNADIMVCVAAGNSGPGSGSTTVSQSAVNGLAVGAVNPTAKTVASFSSRGPMSGDSQRFYPDIAACGVGTVMAARDNEPGTYVASGTSMASPQVCGAATQLRGRFPSLTAVETKAILLVSTEDVAAQNPGLTRNDFGMGFLRNDRSHFTASSGQFGSASVSTSAMAHTFTVPATAGRTYSIAIAWHRLDVTSTAWSNLELEILDSGGAVLASSTSPRNLYEVVRFVSTLTGTLTIRTRAVTIGGGASQPFAWAWNDLPTTNLAGSATSYGPGCPGSAFAPNVCGSINRDGGTLVVETSNREYGYVVPLATAVTLDGIGVFSRSNTGLPVTVGAAIYANVNNRPATTPLAQTTITIGAAVGFHAGSFTPPVTVPAGLVWIGVDHRAGTTLLSNVTVGSTVATWSRTTYASGTWSPASLTMRPALRIHCPGGGPGAIPFHVAMTRPAIGTSLDLALGQARSNAPAVMVLGASDSSWLGGGLPYPLAALGAPGCSLLASTELSVSAPTDQTGAATFILPLPNQSALIAALFHTQCLVVDPAANPLGLAVSNAIRVLVGN